MLFHRLQELLLLATTQSGKAPEAIQENAFGVSYFLPNRRQADDCALSFLVEGHSSQPSDRATQDDLFMNMAGLASVVFHFDLPEFHRRPMVTGRSNKF